MPEVESSAIKRVSYSSRRRELLVFFNSGRAYIYFDVPADEYDTLINSRSLGRQFNSNIRDHYRFSELTLSHH